MELETHNKLVRGKVIDKLVRKGIVHTFHMGDEHEYKAKLYEKLVEEARELVAAMDSLLRQGYGAPKEELADLLEVIEAVKKLNGWSTEEVEEIRLKKLEKEGGFEEPFILEECEKKA